MFYYLKGFSFLFGISERLQGMRTRMWALTLSILNFLSTQLLLKFNYGPRKDNSASIYKYSVISPLDLNASSMSFYPTSTPYDPNQNQAYDFETWW